jgi:hypothetical protein
VLEEAITRASGNCIKRLRAAYEEAEILSGELRATEQQVAALLDQQVTDLMAPSSVINMPAYPPLLKWQYTVPQCLRSVKEQADRMAMELAEQTAAELAEPPWATLRFALGSLSAAALHGSDLRLPRSARRGTWGRDPRSAP